MQFSSNMEYILRKQHWNSMCFVWINHGMFTLYHLYFRFPEIEVQVAFSTGEIVGNSKE